MWLKARTVPESLALLGQLSGECLCDPAFCSTDLDTPVCIDGDGDNVSLAQLIGMTAFAGQGDIGLMQRILDLTIVYEVWHHHGITERQGFLLRQSLAFWQKADFLPIGVDRDKVAMNTFIKAEEKCLDTNRRLQYAMRKPNYIPASLHSVFHYAAGKISDVLGDVPDPSELTFSFGPGANTNVKGATASPRVKLSASLQCSHNLQRSMFLHRALETVTPWLSLHAVDESEDSVTNIIEEAHGKVVFVPKNAKTNRTICVEPLLNSFFQKGFGGYIRNRLLRAGLDLRDQTHNQMLAQIGSVTGKLATVDLSSASDCIARELVWLLLPFDWAQTLDDIRTDSVLYPKGALAFKANVDVAVVLEKFSSMGNGFTFELESLLFWALAVGTFRQVHKRQPTRLEVNVYGDDIILPSDCVSLFTEVLNFAGFKVNSLKSYAGDVPFRESCGADFYLGTDIRPFYQKTLVSDQTLFSLYNFFVRRCEFKLAEVVKGAINPQVILWGPDGYGDGHLVGSHTLRKPRKTKRDQWEGGFFDTYTLKPRSFKKALVGDSVLPAYSVYIRSGRESDTDPYVVRGTRGYAKVSIYTLAETVFEQKRLNPSTIDWELIPFKFGE